MAKQTGVLFHVNVVNIVILFHVNDKYFCHPAMTCLIEVLKKLKGHSPLHKGQDLLFLANTSKNSFFLCFMYVQRCVNE